MARYGARNSKWAVFSTEKADEDPKKLPKYNEKKSFGELNKVTDTINTNEGSLAGDDSIVLYRKQFKDGTVEAESVFLPVADAAVMLGSPHDDTMGVAHTTDDNAPYIGYGFTTMHVSKTIEYYQVVFYPKLRASKGSDTYETRGENITFATDKMSFHLESPLCRVYKIEKDFPTEAEATTYLDSLFAGTAAIPGIPASAPSA